MYKKLLNQFFKENTVANDAPNAQALAHFCMRLELNPEANEKMNELMNNEILEFIADRKQSVLAEKAEIESTTTYEPIIRLMRRNTDPVNQNALVNKAMEFESEMIPEITRMLKTSRNIGFIESTVRILTRSKIEIAATLIGYFDEMNSPYAQSMVLIVLGFKADESQIPWFMEQYKKLKNSYPHENYCEGAYYALLEMEERFYPIRKGKNK